MFGWTERILRNYHLTLEETLICAVKKEHIFRLSQIQGILKAYAYALTSCICFFFIECIKRFWFSHVEIWEVWKHISNGHNGKIRVY